MASPDRSPQPSRPPTGEAQKKRVSFAIFWLVLMLAVIAILQLPATIGLGAGRISYTELKDLALKEKKVERVTIAGDQITAKLRGKLPVHTLDAREPRVVDEVTAVRPAAQDDPKLVEDLQAAGIDVEVRSVDNTLISFIASVAVPLVIFVALGILIMRRLNPQKQVMAFGKSRVKLYAEKETRVTFEDVAGIDEAKEELQEVIDFLREPEPFRRLGARVPHGVLLVGPPGTGKTLLARAVAGEANVAFMSLTGSDFVEMFAGVGAARVRDLFEQAARQAPCIVFIDELDALGKVRGGISLSGAHDEREQTLNQLLAEMDGFDPNSGVVILAATNRPEILDPALLRPGRFDRQVVVDRPDRNGREAILKVHAKKVKLAPDVDLAKVAKATPGFVGADLANIVNEAALLAGRRRKDAVSMKEIEEAIERTVAGLEKKKRLMQPRERERIAHHEGGHALVALSVGHADPVHRVSIIPRGVAALGYTLQLPQEDRYLLTQSELEDRIAVMLGGRAAERLVFGEVSTGAADDLERALRAARRMVRDFGMSERFGAVAFGGERHARFLDGADGLGMGETGYSDETAREIDAEIRRIISSAEKRVDEILKKREPALRAIAAALIEKEVIEHDELVAIASAHGAPPVASLPTAEESARRELRGEAPRS